MTLGNRYGSVMLIGRRVFIQFASPVPFKIMYLQWQSPGNQLESMQSMIATTNTANVLGTLIVASLTSLSVHFIITIVCMKPLATQYFFRNADNSEKIF